MSAQVVLDRPRLDEVRDLLGPAKFSSALGLFKTQLDQSFALTEIAEQAIGSLQPLAHQLASSAGFLGFEELSSTSRHVMTVKPDTLQAVRDLHGAVVRAQQVLSEFVA